MEIMANLTEMEQKISEDDKELELYVKKHFTKGEIDPATLPQAWHYLLDDFDKTLKKITPEMDQNPMTPQIFSWILYQSVHLANAKSRHKIKFPPFIAKSAMHRLVKIICKTKLKKIHPTQYYMQY